MKRIGLCLVGLILVVSFAQIAVTSSDEFTYDRMADINRDGTVDVHDLNRLGEAYGSSLVLPSEPSKIVVTVLSFDKEPPEVENARVAVVDPNDVFTQCVIAVDYTNSSGIVTFELTPSKEYTVIAWSGSAYNYANLTTNTLGESSILVLLGEPLMPPIHKLPQGWIVVTFLDNITGSVHQGDTGYAVYKFEWYGYDLGWSATELNAVVTPIGVVVLLPSFPFEVNNPYSSYGIGVFDSQGNKIGYSVYCPDKNKCANVVVYVTPP